MQHNPIVTIGRMRSIPFADYASAEAFRSLAQSQFPQSCVAIEYWAMGGYWCRTWYDAGLGCMKTERK